MRKSQKSKFWAGVLSFIIISLLIASGPAQALHIFFDNFPNSAPVRGAVISTTAIITLNSDSAAQAEILVDQVSLCSFNLGSGKDCNGISVSLLSSNLSSYGYGYGYGYGTSSSYVYNISIDTAKLSIGMHDIILQASTLGHVYSSQPKIIVIYPQYSTGTESKKVINQQHAVLNFNNPRVDIELNLNNISSGTLTAVEYYTLPSGISNFSLPALGIYLDIIDRNNDFSLNGTIIKMYYSDADLLATGIDESTLRLAFYNDSSSSWEVLDAPNGGVNTAENYVWAKTDHFSFWGAFGRSALDSDDDGEDDQDNRLQGRCVTDWTCSGWSSCENGIQRRECVKKDWRCDAALSKPEETQQCINLQVDEGEKDDGNNIPLRQSGITGAVTGFLGTPSGILSISIFLLLLAIATMLLINLARMRRINRLKALKSEKFY